MAIAHYLLSFIILCRLIHPWWSTLSYCLFQYKYSVPWSNALELFNFFEVKKQHFLSLEVFFRRICGVDFNESKHYLIITRYRGKLQEHTLGHNIISCVIILCRLMIDIVLFFFQTFAYDSCAVNGTHKYIYIYVFMFCLIDLHSYINQLLTILIRVKPNQIILALTYWGLHTRNLHTVNY